MPHLAHDCTRLSRAQTPSETSGDVLDFPSTVGPFLSGAEPRPRVRKADVKTVRTPHCLMELTLCSRTAICSEGRRQPKPVRLARISGRARGSL